MEVSKKPEFGTRETGMFVPEGFFADFQKNLEQQIDKKVHRYTLVRRWSIAASICLILGLTPLFWNVADSNSETTQPELLSESSSVDDLNSEEIFTSTISDYDIYEYFYADL